MKYYYVKYQDERGNTKQTEPFIDFSKAYEKYINILLWYKNTGDYKKLQGFYRTTKIRCLVK